VRCINKFTIPEMSYIVTVRLGWLVTQTSHARFMYVLSGPHRDTSRGWRLLLKCGGKQRMFAIV